MVQRFGSREICDVTFKALNEMKVGTKTIKAGQPVFVIDTAQTSSMEQATTVVYAQGGRGYNRLIAWEGEKTMTFNVTDALMSPLGLAMLTSAGLVEAEDKPIHVHTTIDATTDANGVTNVSLDQLIEELGLPLGTSTAYICADTHVKPYATILDNNGSIKDWADVVTVEAFESALADSTTELISVQKDKPAKFTVKQTINDVATAVASKLVKLDFYVVMKSGATQITIEPNAFGGYFYVEADTLYRNEDGKDMAATLTYPKVKINSAFTISMAANGDPSTFDFQMDAMPAYTYFDKTKKVVCDIAIVGGDTSSENSIGHKVNQDQLTHTPTLPAGE